MASINARSKVTGTYDLSKYKYAQDEPEDIKDARKALNKVYYDFEIRRYVAEITPGNRDEFDTFDDAFAYARAKLRLLK